MQSKKIIFLRFVNEILCFLSGFVQYLTETSNTICGRNPIAILLRVNSFFKIIFLFLNENFVQILEKSKLKGLKTKLLKYAQSSQVEENNDSSVSYAACVTYIES